MITVLLADSDTETTRNFHSYIKTSFPAIRDVRVTNDTNKDILDTIKAVKPQLIIANIRFFGLGNIQKIIGVHDRYPTIRFILYGSFYDSEYMKKSMDFGVIDYMYRPIRPSDFHRCLASALDYFKKEEDNKKKETEFKKSYMEKKCMFEAVFLSGLIEGRLKNEAEILSSFQYFGFDLSPDYTVFAVRVDHFKKIILTMDEMEKHILSHKILLIVEKKLENSKAKAFIGNFNLINVIISGNYELEQLVSLCDDIKGAIYKETGIRVTVGIGRTYGRCTDIAVSYREAQGALRYRFQMGYNTVIHILFVEPVNTITYRYPIEREAKLIYTAAIGEYDYSVALLREIFDVLKESAPLPEMYLSKVIMNILISINRNLEEQNIKIQSQFTSFFPSKEVLELGNDIDEAYDYLSKALKNFCDHIVKSRNENNKALVDKAKRHIEERYYEIFSIAKLATEIGTTPDYLNKVFSGYEGKNVLEYTINVRMAEAKRLMRETKLDDNMVAVKIGYENGRHFRSMFKKHEKASTNEYRAQYNYFMP